MAPAGGRGHARRTQLLRPSRERQSSPPIQLTDAPSYDLAFNPGGTRLAVALGIAGDPHRVDDGASTAKIVDLTTRTVTGAGLSGHSASISTVAFSPDGTMVATGGNDDLVILHDAETGQPIGEPMRVHKSVNKVAFDPARPRIAVTSFGTWCADLRHDDTAAAGAIRLGTNPSSGLAYDATGDKLAVGGDGPVTVYDAADFTPSEAPVDAQTGNAQPTFVGGRLAVGGTTGPVTVWDKDGQSPLVRLVPGATTYVFPDARGSSHCRARLGRLGNPLRRAQPRADQVRHSHRGPVTPSTSSYRRRSPPATTTAARSRWSIARAYSRCTRCRRATRSATPSISTWRAAMRCSAAT